MSLLNKLDPNQIFALATSVIDAKKNLSEMQVKAETYVKALHEQEETARKVLSEHTKQFEIVIDALRLSIDSLQEPEHKLVAINLLAEYGNKALHTLGETSKQALVNSREQFRLNS